MKKILYFLFFILLIIFILVFINNNNFYIEEKLEVKKEEVKENVGSIEEKYIEQGENKRDKINHDMTWERIVELAEERGYKKREEISFNKLGKYKGILLDKKMLPFFKRLDNDMKKDGIKLNLISGFRSIGHQKIIFDRKILQQCEKISLCSEQNINNILKVSSIPGYSKHHSGRTIDVSCGDSYSLDQNFRYTDCYEWLMNNSKKYNFYPSYPDIEEKQGPDPEPWEFIWIK